MPFFESGATPQPVFPDAAPPYNPIKPSLSETIGAAFLKNNPMVNLFRSQHVDMYPPEEGHNPMDIIRGSKYEERYANRFIGSRSTSETAAIIRRIDEEEQASSTLDAAGFAGTVASIAAGTLDPTIALPAGTIYRGAKGGISLLRSGVSTAVAGGAQVAVQEAALHGLQETRTKLESTTAIGSGVLLAGFIGTSAAALLSRAERGVLTRSIDHTRAEIDAHARGEPPPEPPRLEPATDRTAAIGRPEPTTPEQMAEIRARLDESSARVQASAVQPEPASVAAVESAPPAAPAAAPLNHITARENLGQAISDFIGHKVEVKGPKSQLDIGEVTNGKGIMDAGGLTIDPTGYRVTLDSDALKHVARQRGLSMSPDDIARIPEIVSSPDKIEGGPRNVGERKRYSVQFTKRIGDQDVTVVMESLRTKKELRLKTMFKDKVEATSAENAPVAPAGAPNGEFVNDISSGKIPVPTTDELTSAINATQSADREGLKAFGLTDKDYSRLQTLNRQIDNGSDAAIREKNELLKNVPHDYEPNIADEGVLRQLRNEFSALEKQDHESAAEFADGMARVLKRYISGFIDGEAFSRSVFMKAFEEARTHGIDTRVLGNDVIKRFLGDLSDSDAAFMRQEFEKFTRPKIEAPAPPAGKTVDDGLRFITGDTARERRPAVWASGDHNIPVTILDKPTMKGNDGRVYQQVEFEGKQSWLPADELREGSAGEASPEAGSALPQSGGAAAADSRRLEMVPYGLAWTSRVAPTRHVVEASSIPARRIMADTASMPYTFKDNIAPEGQAPIATTHGTPIDIQARIDIDGSKVRLHDELGHLFADYRFGDPGATAPRIRAQAEHLLGRDEGRMTYKEFSEQVTWATLHNDQHAIPQIAQAAQFVRREIYNKWLGRAKDINLFGPDVEVKTAESYGQRVMNKEAIKADLKGFVDVQAGWYATEQATKRRAQDRIFSLIEARNKISDVIEKSGSEDEKVAARLQHKEITDKITNEVASWEGKSADSAKKAIQARLDELADRAEKRAKKTGAAVEAPKLSRTKKLDEAVDRAVEKILKSDQEFTTEELRNRAQETADRYLGTPDGRLPYDVDSGGPGIGWRPDRDPPRGPLAARVNNIPDVNLWKYMERDIEHVVATHLRTIVPDVLLTERHGDVHMTFQLKQVLDDYNTRIEAAKSQKAKDALTKEKEGVIERIVGVRDRIRNVFDWSATGEKMGRVANVAKQFTNITTGGVFALASLADFAGSIFRSTLNGTLRDGWVPYLKGVMNLDEGAYKKFIHEIRALSIGTDVTNNSMRGLDDAMDMYRPQTRFERTLAWANDKFFIANFLAPMTDMQKHVAAHPIASNIIRYSKAAAEGKATSEQLTSLASAGIHMNLAGKIWQNFSENGGEIINGIYLPNTKNWKGRDAADAFNGALYRDVNIAVVTPGQEKPLFLSTQVGSILGLYKTFTAAATEKILIANLQKRDASTLQGLVAAVGLGMLSYKLNAMLGGQKTSDRPQDWIKEGVSRSGVGGWFEEANALASKSTRGGVDIYRMLGADKPLSRYAARSTLDQLLGPTAGKIESMLKVTGAAGSKLTGAKDNDWTAADTAAVRKLTAFQNMIWLRNINNQLEEALNGRLGVEMKVH